MTRSSHSPHPRYATSFSGHCGQHFITFSRSGSSYAKMRHILITRLPPQDLHALFALSTPGRPSRLPISRITFSVEERVEAPSLDESGTRLSSTRSSPSSRAAGTPKDVIVTTQREPGHATSVYLPSVGAAHHGQNSRNGDTVPPALRIERVHQSSANALGVVQSKHCVLRWILGAQARASHEGSQTSQHSPLISNAVASVVGPSCASAAVCAAPLHLLHR